MTSSRAAGHLHHPLAPALPAALTTKKAQKTVFFLRSACAFDVAGVDNPQHDQTIAKPEINATSKSLESKPTSRFWFGVWDARSSMGTASAGAGGWDRPASKRSTD